MLEQVRIRPYSVHESSYMLQASELYSGGENDPITDATIHAMDNLALDSRGNNLPFSIYSSIFALDNFDREKEMLEDQPKAIRRWSQKLNVTVIVWSNERDKEIFDNNDNVFLV